MVGYTLKPQAIALEIYSGLWTGNGSFSVSFLISHVGILGSVVLWQIITFEYPPAIPLEV